MEIHKLFENQYKQLEESIDEIAERINKLGKNNWNMAEFTELTTLRNPKQIPISKVTELLNDHETVIVSLRKGIDISEKENKRYWYC
jgi:starvation-inducible DNA-binding protein